MSNQGEVQSTSIFATMGPGPSAAVAEAQESLVQTALDTAQDLTHQGSNLLSGLEQRQEQAVRDVETHLAGAVQSIEQHHSDAIDDVERHRQEALHDIDQHREEALRAIETLRTQAEHELDLRKEQQEGSLDAMLPQLATAAITAAIAPSGGALAAVVPMLVEAALPALRDMAMQLVRELIEHELSNRGHH